MGRTKISVTRHAFDRFHERCRPDQSRKAAEQELLYYADIEDLLDEPPWKVNFHKKVMGWLPIGTDSVGIVVPHRKHGHPTVITCLSIRDALELNPAFHVKKG